MSLRQTERALYQDVWTSLEAYGQHAPGEHYVDLFLDCALLKGAYTPAEITVLDAGCGSGKGGLALAAQKFDVTLCDVTDAGLVADARRLRFHEACLWHDLSHIARGKGHPGRTRFDYVYCCDVLEHLPSQFTMLAVDQMLRVASKGVFLSVSLVPDQFGMWVGKPLHQTVQSFTWWKSSLSELGSMTDARDLHHNAVFFVRPR